MKNLNFYSSSLIFLVICAVFGIFHRGCSYATQAQKYRAESCIAIGGFLDQYDRCIPPFQPKEKTK